MNMFVVSSDCWKRSSLLILLCFWHWCTWNSTPYILGNYNSLWCPTSLCHLVDSIACLHSASQPVPCCFLTLVLDVDVCISILAYSFTAGESVRDIIYWQQGRLVPDQAFFFGEAYYNYDNYVINSTAKWNFGHCGLGRHISLLQMMQRLPLVSPQRRNPHSIRTWRT